MTLVYLTPTIVFASMWIAVIVFYSTSINQVPIVLKKKTSISITMHFWLNNLIFRHYYHLYQIADEVSFSFQITPKKLIKLLCFYSLELNWRQLGHPRRKICQRKPVMSNRYFHPILFWIFVSSAPPLYPLFSSFLLPSSSYRSDHLFTLSSLHVHKNSA